MKDGNCRHQVVENAAVGKRVFVRNGFFMQGVKKVTLILLGCCLTFSVPVFAQQGESFDSVLNLATANLGIDYDIVSISPGPSPEADALVQQLSRGKSPRGDDRVVHLALVRSNDPLTSAQYELGLTRATAGMGRELNTMTESKANDILMTLVGVGNVNIQTVDIQTVVSICVSQVVVKAQMKDLEIWVRAKNRENGRGHYMYMAYISAQVPSDEMITQVILSVAANNGTPGRGGKTPTSTTPTQTAEETRAFAEFVTKLLSENPDWKAMDERFKDYFGK